MTNRTTSRVQAPPVNLKERIAALQQRNVSATQRPPSPTHGGSSTSGGVGGGGLRDKIAKFEQKGGVPVPRGSFGLGAPPVAENGQARRRGELYGNRIPGPLRVASGGGLPSRSGSPLPAGARTPTRTLYPDDASPTSTLAGYSSPSSDSPSSPSEIPASPPLTIDYSQAAHSPSPSPQRTAFTAALDAARRSASASDALGRYDAREMSRSPSPPPSQPSLPAMLPDDDLPHQISALPVVEIPSEEIQPPLNIPDEKIPEIIDTDHFAEGDSKSSLAILDIPPSIVVSSEEPLTACDALQEAPNNLSDLPQVEDPVETDTQNPTTPHLDTTLAVVVSSGETTPTPIIVPPGVHETIAVDIAVEPDISQTSPVLETPISEDDYNYSPLAATPPTIPSTDAHCQPEVPLSLTPEIEEPVLHQRSSLIPDSGDAAILGAEGERPSLGADGKHDNSEELKPDSYAPYLDGLGIDNTGIYSSIHSWETSPTISITTPETENERENVSSSELPETHSPEVETTEEARDDFPISSQEISPAISVSTPDAERELILEKEEMPEKHQGEEGDVFLVMDGPAQIPESPLAKLAYDVLDTPSTSPSPSPLLESTPVPSPSPSPSPAHLSFPSAQSIGSSRPHSMVEGRVAVAQRVSPVTSRGTPMFIPPSRQKQRTDQATVAVAEISPSLDTPQEVEFGTISLHKQSQSYSYPQNYLSHYAEPNLADPSGSKASTFSAVVHGKVTERPSSSSSSMPALSRQVPTTPQMSRVQRSMKVEVPMSPGFGELSRLVEEAAQLERRLLEGDIPSEVEHRSPEQPTQGSAPVEEQPPPPRVLEPSHEPVEQNRPKSIFRNPLTRSKSAHRREPSNLAVQTSLPSREPRHGRARSSVASVRVPFIPQSSPHQEPVPSVPLAPKEEPEIDNAEEIPPTPPPKSPRPRYFSGLRRLASNSSNVLRSSTTMPGAYPRHSVSTSSEISSEDSIPVITPPDNSLDFACVGNGASGSEFGHGSKSVSRSVSAGAGAGAGVPWPSVSPKKSGSISRASLFAEKIWHRARTKSSGSTVSTSDMADRIAAESVAQPLPTMPESVSFAPSAIAQEPMTNTAPEPIISPPTRSSSLHPKNDPTRPTSWISVSSTTSSILPSPLFDKELFDAFPSVPQATPPAPTPGQTYGHNRVPSRPSLPLPASLSTGSFSSSGFEDVLTPTTTQLQYNVAPLRFAAKSLGRSTTMPHRRPSPAQP